MTTLVNVLGIFAGAGVTVPVAMTVGYRPVDLLAVALGVLVLTVIIRQVVGLRRRNRLAERARQARRRPVLERDDPDPWEPLPRPVTCGGLA